MIEIDQTIWNDPGLLRESMAELLGKADGPITREAATSWCRMGRRIAALTGMQLTEVFALAREDIEDWRAAEASHD